MAKKPKGKTGPVSVTIIDDSGNAKLLFDQIKFPEGKDDTERYIVNRFIESINKGLANYGETFILSNPQKNELDDFDFRVSTPKGTGYLELMEVAPLEGTKGGYSSAPSSYRPYDFSHTILEKILKKSDKYPKNLDNELFLLIYVTYWSFSLNEIVIALLRYYLSKENLAFRAIFLYDLLDQDEGVVRWLYPVPPDLIQGIDPKEFKDNLVINLNPEKFELKTSKQS